MGNAISTRNLCKTYGTVRALSNCTIQVPAGSIYGLVGRNGAGKTTLFRILCGLQQPTAGAYSLWDTGSADPGIAQVRRRIGAIVETPNIIPGMSAEDNLRARLMLLGLTDTRRVPQILQQVGLENTGRRRASAFSLGMRQRLGIALALAGSPDLLILDEPANGLDPQGILEIRELICRLNRDEGMTFVISSHILDELARIATHFGFMDAGHIVQQVSAREVHDQCRRSVVLSVLDASVLPPVLDRMHLEYTVESPSAVVVYGDPDMGPLVTALEKAGAHVHRIEPRSESLETYYLRLVGGEKS